MYIYKIKRLLKISRYCRLIVNILEKNNFYNENLLDYLILLKTLHNLSLNNNFGEKKTRIQMILLYIIKKLKFSFMHYVYISLNFLFIVCLVLNPLTQSFLILLDSNFCSLLKKIFTTIRLVNILVNIRYLLQSVFRVDSALRALSTLRGLRGAPEVPPLYRGTQSLGQQMLNVPVSINGLMM